MQNCGCKGTKNYTNNALILNYFVSLQQILTILMKDYAPLIGVLLIVAGTGLLLTAYLAHYTTNTILAAGLLLIVAGVIGYIQAVKHSNRY